MAKSAEKLNSIVIVCAFALYFAFISLTSIAQKSPTHDEPLHLFAGYAYLKWGDFRVNPEHPPLAKLLAAIPLMMQRSPAVDIERAERDAVQQDREYAWVLANRFLFSDGNAEVRFFLGRLPIVSLGIVLGVLIFIVARDLYGSAAALAALAIYALDPNIIAHSSIIHTDIPFALFLFGSSYFFWRSLSETNFFNVVLAAVFFALATVTKFSFSAIPAIWAALGAIWFFRTQPHGSERTPLIKNLRLCDKAVLLTLVFSAAAVTSYIVIWCAYGIRFDSVAYQKGTLPFARLLREDPWLVKFVHLNADYFVLPEAWVYGLISAVKSVGRPSYLLGEVSDHGFWLYFPIAFAVKTPLPTLLLLLTAIILVVFDPHRQRVNIVLLVPVVMYFLLAVFSKINIGVRHILPIYPFLFVWIGGAVGKLWLSKNLATRCYLLTLGVWLVGSTIWTYPDYLAFFNEIIGGPRNGQKVLVDSNLDWGQDLKGLKRWMDNHRVDRITLAYFGTVDPCYYGIHAVHPEGSFSRPPIGLSENQSLTTAYTAISATHLAGLYLRERETYAQFRDIEPVTSIGHSIFIYRTDKRIGALNQRDQEESPAVPHSTSRGKLTKPEVHSD